MSALLSWMGGGLTSTSIFVALNCLLTYGAFCVMWGDRRQLSALRVLVCVALIANPMIFAYVGIVWKDVLMGSWIAATFGFCVLAERSVSARSRSIILALTLALLGAGSLIRQQGIIVGPLLAIAPLLIVFKNSARSERWLWLAGSAGLFVFSMALTNTAAKYTVVGNGGRDMSQGPTFIEVYDIAGITVLLSPEEAMRTIPGLTPDTDARMRKGYRPERADFLDSAWFESHLSAQAKLPLRDIWLTAVKRHPVDYARHRVRLFMRLSGAGNIYECLPTYVGVAGVEPFLSGVHLKAEVSERAQMLFDLQAKFFSMPIWKNWFYIAGLVVLTVAAIAIKRARHRTSVLVYLGTLIVFVGGFLPTAIACDFRYLYPIIPPLTAIALLMLSESAALE